jgi:ABC-type sulfate transport system substrate-binding protein
MEVIKKTLEVKDALGWYLMRSEYRTWTETVDDEETGEPVEVERKEVVCGKGTQVNPIIQSLLEGNGVTEIEVSNVPILGEQDKYLNLWETALKVRYAKGGGKDCKRSYFVTADCPAAAEAFIAGYFVLNVEASFELVKVNKLDYNKVIRMYDTERDEYEADRTKHVRWYKCQIYSMVDDDDTGDRKTAGMKNILVQAVSFEKAIAAIKTVLNRDEYDAIYNTIKLLQELTVVDVFIPEESVSYYSNEEI